MNTLPIQEPPIDVSLHHYMEERALAIALEKATTREEREQVTRLMESRSALMQHRDAYMKEAIEKRLARGEIYSASRVAAINAMGPGRAQLDASVRSLYLRQPSSRDVLKAHARTHFTQSLMSQRLLLADMPSDILEAARSMQKYEEAFAKAWLAAIGDPNFDSKLRGEQRQALVLFRTSARPMYLVTSPPSEQFDDIDARELGKVWAKLDKLSESIGFEPLSNFIALDDEGDSAGVSGRELLRVVEALISAVASPGQKFPSKRSTVSVLTKIREDLARLNELGGRAYFQIDT